MRGEASVRRVPIPYHLVQDALGRFHQVPQVGPVEESVLLGRRQRLLHLVDDGLYSGMQRQGRVLEGKGIQLAAHPAVYNGRERAW